MPITDSVAQSTSAFPALDTVRVEYNKLAAWTSYIGLNGLASTTVATTPAVTIATDTAKVKTTNATVLRNAGALNALAASDDFWTLTGGVLAVSSFRRYLLLCDAADAATVLASDDVTTAAEDCRWATLPANGLAIVGILTVATNSSTTFTPGTTALSAAGVTDTYVDGYDISVPPMSIVTP
jgi:hypothetical protein